MSIIYILTIILIIGLHMLIYKKEEKENFLKGLILTISLLLCYNIVTCVILSFIKIKSTLITLSIINTIVIAILGMKIFKDKKIQKYYINKMDILAVISIIIIVVIISIKQYGIPINIKSSTTDWSTHYLIAEEFYNHSILLMEENSDLIGWWNEDFWAPGAYVNTGIVFKVLSPVIEEAYFPQLFVIFEISMWIFSGILMYVLLSNSKKSEKQKIIPLIFSIIYILGYPLHTILSGFSYLQVGLNIIITILLIMQNDENTLYKYIVLFLSNFGLMFSYYYFAPVVFFAIFVQILIDIKIRNEKIFSSVNILKILFALIIPGLFGVMYFIVFQKIKQGTSIFSEFGNVINTPGPIYDNLITTILIFLLLSIYNIIKNIKNKKNDFLNTILIVNITLMIGIFIGMKLQKVSEYYFFKLYYMLWVFLLVGAYNAVEYLKEKRKMLIYGGMCLYCIGMIVSILFNKNILFFDIYQENFRLINEDFKIISHEELEIFKYYNNNIDTIENSDDTTYIYVNNVGRSRWVYPLTKNGFIFIDAFYNEPFVDIQQFLDKENYKHCIIFKLENEEIYNNIENVENIKILFKNEAGVIIEKY